MNRLDDLRGLELDLAVARELNFNEVCTMEDLSWNEIVFDGEPLFRELPGGNFRRFRPSEDVHLAWQLPMENWVWTMTEFKMGSSRGVRTNVLKFSSRTGIPYGVLATCFVGYSSRRPNQTEQEQVAATSRCIAWLRAREQEEKDKGEKRC